MLARVAQLEVNLRQPMALTIFRGICAALLAASWAQSQHSWNMVQCTQGMLRLWSCRGPLMHAHLMITWRRLASALDVCSSR